MRRLAALLPLALAACATLAPAPPALAPGAGYVAMGSSYAAGPGIRPAQPGAPERCGRSQLNYPSLLAAALHLSLTDASCSGSRTVHLLDAWDELPAEVEAVGPDTRLVTITVGGNDINFVGSMFAASCRAGVETKRLADRATGACAALTIPAAADYAAVEGRMEELVRRIRTRAPQAQVVFVQYPRVIPDAPCAAAPLREDDRRALTVIGDSLAALTRRAAEATGARVLDAYALSRGHTACDPQPWSSALYDGFGFAAAAPWHPNAAGHAAIARALERTLAGR